MTEMRPEAGWIHLGLGPDFWENMHTNTIEIQQFNQIGIPHVIEVHFTDLTRTQRVVYCLNYSCVAYFEMQYN